MKLSFFRNRDIAQSVDPTAPGEADPDAWLDMDFSAAARSKPTPVILAPQQTQVPAPTAEPLDTSDAEDMLRAVFAALDDKGKPGPDISQTEVAAGVDLAEPALPDIAVSTVATQDDAPPEMGEVAEAAFAPTEPAADAGNATAVAVAPDVETVEPFVAPVVQAQPAEDDILRQIVAAGAIAEAEIRAESVPKGRKIFGFRRKKKPGPAEPVPERPKRRPEISPLAVAVFAPVMIVVAGAWLGRGLPFMGLLAAIGGAAALGSITGSTRAATSTAPLPGRAGDYAVPAAVAALIATLAGLGFAGQTGVLGGAATCVALGIWLAVGPVRQARYLSRNRLRSDRRQADVLFVALFMGHRGASERLVIPRFAATADDPHTAEPGEGFWSFVARSIPASFVAAHAMTETLMRPLLGRRRTYVHPFLLHILASASLAVVVGAAFGLAAVPALLLIAAVAQIGTALDDYVLRYGLVRHTGANGKPEPLSSRHHWTAPLPFGRGQGEATLPGPVYPRPLAVMALLALVPRLWSAEMDARVMAMRKAGPPQRGANTAPGRPGPAASRTITAPRLARTGKL